MGAKRYTEAEREAAVNVWAAEGCSLRELERRTGIQIRTLSLWKSRNLPEPWDDIRARARVAQQQGAMDRIREQFAGRVGDALTDAHSQRRVGRILLGRLADDLRRAPPAGEKVQDGQTPVNESDLTLRYQRVTRGLKTTLEQEMDVFGIPNIRVGEVVNDTPQARVLKGKKLEDLSYKEMLTMLHQANDEGADE